jgi:hypothetical protein
MKASLMTANLVERNLNLVEKMLSPYTHRVNIYILIYSPGEFGLSLWISKGYYRFSMASQLFQAIKYMRGI